MKYHPIEAKVDNFNAHGQADKFQESFGAEFGRKKEIDHSSKTKDDWIKTVFNVAKHWESR